VVDAEDGEKGIQQVRSGDNPVMVDKILCDIYMAKVHNGVEAVAYFRQQFPSVPVIVMTGQPDVKGATDLIKQGVVDYLIKPVRPEKLTEVVSRHTEAISTSINLRPWGTNAQRQIRSGGRRIRT
jgi:two-component system chemotaxis response regulator CheY